LPIFQWHIEQQLDILRKYQPNEPAMVTEFWSGWYDHWGEQHHTFPAGDFEKNLRTMLIQNASFSLYLFAGGTNFGFTNGANVGGSSKLG